jgi:hypothetical protein
VSKKKRPIDEATWNVVGHFARAAAAVGLIAVAIGLAVANEPDSGRAAVIAGLAVLAVVLLVLTPDDIRRFVKRIQNIKAPGVEVGLAKETADAAEPEDREQDEEPVGRARDVLDLRLKLEAKMAYIAKHLLAEYEGTPGGDDFVEHPTFVTIGSLQLDGYLSGEEAEVASQVLSYSENDLASLPAGERRKFITNADKTVGGIRASVFRGMVKKVLSDNGFDVADDVYGASLGGRPDLHVRRAEEQPFRVVPAFAVSQPSKILKKARDNLVEADSPEPARRIVVVPDRPNSPTATNDPRATKLPGLVQLLDS